MIGNATVITTSRRNRLYCLEALVIVGSSCVTADDSLNLWFKRLGHVGEKDLEN